MTNQKIPINTHVMTVTVDAQIYTVEYKIESYGYPSNNWDDPGSPPEITIWRLWLNEEGEQDAGYKFMQTIDSKLLEKIEQETIINIDSSDCDD